MTAAGADGPRWTRLLPALLVPVSLLPDLAAATTYDYRRTSKQILDALNAYLLGRATANQLDVVNTAIADRNVGRDIRSLLQLREQLKAEVALEDYSPPR